MLLTRQWKIRFLLIISLYRRKTVPFPEIQTQLNKYHPLPIQNKLRERLNNFGGFILLVWRD